MVRTNSDMSRSNTVILNEVKDLPLVLAAHNLFSMTVASIVRFLAPLGMTRGSARSSQEILIYEKETC